MKVIRLHIAFLMCTCICACGSLESAHENTTSTPAKILTKEVDDCGFDPWITHEQTQLSRWVSSGAYWLITDHKAVDADGAPNAYHPEDVGKPCGPKGWGLDCPANAGYARSKRWADVLVTDPLKSGRAYVQGRGLFEGFFISKTALVDPSVRETDVNRYVDATEIPYFVFPNNFLRIRGTGKLGDVGYAYNLKSGLGTPFVVADVGPNEPLGEASIKLFENLGGLNVNPRNGAGLPGGRILYILFPYTGEARDVAWPASVQTIRDQTNKHLSFHGGIETILSCVE